MQIHKLCKSYFELEYPKSLQSALVDFFKIVSYFTVVMPLLIGVAYRMTKISPERVSPNPPDGARKVGQVAGKKISRNSSARRARSRRSPNKDYSFRYNGVLSKKQMGDLKEIGGKVGVGVTNQEPYYTILFPEATHNVIQTYLFESDPSKKGQYEIIVSNKQNEPLVSMQITNRASRENNLIVLYFFRNDEFV